MIRQLIKAGALFVANHSGGKDSQAMTIRLQKLIPAHQLVIIHADLGKENHWPGCLKHIQRSHPGINLVEVKAGKTFFQMTDKRRKFPAPGIRQCTSDLKRGPIQKGIRQIAKERGINLIVNCSGERADESTDRKKRPNFRINGALSIAGRTVYDWLPIHRKTEAQVFSIIKDAGQKAHWVYALGMRRCSCIICIYSTPEDIRTANKILPNRVAKYAQKEHEYGFTITMPKKGKQQFISEILKQN